MNRSEPLRVTLRKAVNSREAALRNNRSKRKDEALLRSTICRVQSFLWNYPVADDKRVRAWCIAHEEHIAYLIPGNQSSTFARLVLDPLEANENTAE